MKMTNSELRKQARIALEGNWGKGVSATFIYFLIAGGISSSFGLFSHVEAATVSGSVLWALLCLPLSWGFVVFFLSIFRDKNFSVWTIFDGYKQFGRIFLTMLLINVYTILWTLLLIVPGIIKSLSYSMTQFILLDNPEIGADDAIHRSRVLMDGSKMKLFILYLSFIGWGFLCILTFGVGFLILYPYIETSLAAFYQDLINSEKNRWSNPSPNLMQKFNRNLRLNNNTEVLFENIVVR